MQNTTYCYSVCAEHNILHSVCAEHNILYSVRAEHNTLHSVCAEHNILLECLESRVFVATTRKFEVRH